MAGERRSVAEGSVGHAATAVRAGETVRSRVALPGHPQAIGERLAENLARLGDRPAYAERDGDAYRAITWSAFVRDVAAFADYLSSQGVRPGDRVVVSSPNRGEMLVAEMATMCLGAVYVPIFAGYAEEQAHALVAHAEPSVLLVPGRNQLARCGLPPSVRALVLFDEPAADTARGPERVSPVSIARILREHAPDEPAVAAFLHQAAGRDPTEPVLMMYTSGTSGPLKGVLLTHDNILSQQRALATIWTLGPGDRFLSYLPWHHSFGGIFEKYSAICSGAMLCLDDSFGKDFDRLVENWKAVQPTVYFSVPKVYQQLVARAQTHAADEPRIFHHGLRFVFTAAAPLPSNLSEYLAAREIPVVEGWGLTETSPCCTLTDPGEVRSVPGLVGYPIPGVEIRIAADGEIVVRGPNVMRGYFRDPAATRAALPGDGWFHTGDLGALEGTGLRLIARKDRVFKMLNAEKVVPTEIENRLAGMNKYIRHVIVTGDGRDYLAALIFPDFYRITEEFGADHAAADRIVKDALRETILAFNAGHPVKYERIQAFAVVNRELSIEQQELTPSLKVRVRNVLAASSEYLDAIYHPTGDCDCRFLRRVMRLAGDDRRCFAGLDRSLDRCCECGGFLFDDAPGPIRGAQLEAGGPTA